MRKLFSSFERAGLEYLLISGQATVLYGAATFSEDVDLWIRPTSANARRLLLALADRRARVHLRAATPYVWNATNVTRALRSRCIGLAAGYRARIEVVSVEAPPDVVHRRNSARARRVPAAVIDRMAGRWEPPDPTEAHEVRWVLND